MPVLSIYLDMRPQATGNNPGVSGGEIVLKDRLHEIEKNYAPRELKTKLISFLIRADCCVKKQF